MRYRQMGAAGLRLSVLGLGSYLTIGYKADEETARRTIRLAYEAGVNFFDTANAYHGGEAERVLGKYLKEYPRSSLAVLSKVFAPMGPGPNDRGLSTKHIVEQCHASLQRLGLEYLDVYMCHRPDPTVPLEETIRAMETLALQGKILYWGVSEWSAALMVKAQAVARDVGARPLRVNEPRYSLLYRYPEQEVFPTTLAEGIGNVVFSPLAHGMLTGKYRPGEEAPAGTRAADPDQNVIIRSLYWSEANKERGQQLAALAGRFGCTPAQLAIAWCLRRPEVTSAILGAMRVEQLEDNLGAADLEIPADLAVELETLYPLAAGVPTV